MNGSGAAAGEVDLPDLNVWLALAWPGHPNHERAVQYWETGALPRVVFCTVTALGLIRVQCQPKVMGASVRTAAAASEVLRAFCRLGGVSIAAEEGRGWDVFHALLQEPGFPGSLCTDAYLAALAIEHGWRLVSFDQDFVRLERLRLLIP